MRRFSKRAPCRRDVLGSATRCPANGLNRIQPSLACQRSRSGLAADLNRSFRGNVWVRASWFVIAAILLIRRRSKTFGDYALAANNSHAPGRPLRSRTPRSANFRPAPAVSSVTTRETQTSPGSDCAITREAAWTASPPTSSPRNSISPVCSPARSESPAGRTAGPSASAQRTARPGPSKVASSPSPVLLIQWPRCLSTSCRVIRSCSSSQRRHCRSPASGRLARGVHDISE